MSDGLPPDDQGAGVMDAMEDASSNPAVPTDENLIQLHELVLAQVALEEAVQTLEQELKVRKASLREISEDHLPSKMAELGFQKFTTDDGFNITVKDKVAVSISTANSGPAHEWLRAHGFGDLIKNEITAKFPKGKEAAALEVMESLDAAGHTAVRKERVHASTLKAWVAEQLEAGTTLPESITVFPYSLATIKQP